MKPIRIFLVVLAGVLFGVMLLAQDKPAGQSAGQPVVQPAQSTSPPADSSPTPSLTLDEKISLTVDDLKRQDALQKAQEEFQKAIKPLNDHQEATRQVIEKEHPGWMLQMTQQGWQLVKRPEEGKEKKAAGAQAGAAPAAVETKPAEKPADKPADAAKTKKRSDK